LLLLLPLPLPLGEWYRQCFRHDLLATLLKVLSEEFISKSDQFNLCFPKQQVQ